ncbi:intestinal mucin-like protein, partial [Mastacembelus armatus]|uniref:intestinal mucin-like protein n=1 Tax=Mastacembelus armatus TaxID=205130 RepID=UPI001436BF81
ILSLCLTSTDMMITLDIPAINVHIIYRMCSISINLPYSLFGGNTEGQCGTCDNSQNNDCRSPNGQVESCSDSADQWHVPDTPCVPPTTEPPITLSTTGPSQSTTRPVCKPAICNLLTSSVFAPCHEVVSPGPFVTSCMSDNCNGGNNTCSSLEAYATECSNAGICIDWRDATNGQCEHKCPSNKVYMACGPSVEPTCNNRYNEKFQASSNVTKEGCFCPSGTTLFNTVYDTCVTSCDCVGPDGKPKQPGDTWTSGCNTCVCDKDSMSIQCQPVKCIPVRTPECREPGKELVNKTENCCTKLSCECNVNLCPLPTTCPLGFALKATNGTCCKSYECVPKGVCVYNMTEYKPGDKIPTPGTSEPPLEPPTTPRQPSRTTAAPSGPQDSSSSSEEEISNESFKPGPCQECYCGPTMNPTTKLNVINCSPVVCNMNCSEGYKYQAAPDQCCGTCVQTGCLFTTPDGTTHVMKANETFAPPDDKCVHYTCHRINGQFVTKEIRTSCPHFDPSNCEPGTEKTDANGCCKTCKPRSTCEVQSTPTVIEVKGCKSIAPVDMTSCAGHCGSSSMYSLDANTMMHKCECCQEATTSQKEVMLTCGDGSQLKYSYTDVLTCSCTKAQCVDGGQK